METEKPENLQGIPKRGCRDALHLPVLVSLKSASQSFRMAEQGLFILLYFFKRNGHIREKRKGYSKRGQDTVFVRGFIVLFQLAVCHWHLCLSS